jgi:uncharacterized membrane protein
MSKGLSTLKPPARLSLELLLISGIAIAILIRLLNLASREFWYDEVLSLLLSSGQKAAYGTPEGVAELAKYKALLSLPAESGIPGLIKTIVSLLRGLVGGEPHPPLFFLSQHLWLRLFGNSEAAMRSIGVLLSMGSVAAAFGLGRLILGYRGGLIFAAILAANPFYLFHSLNVRMYGPLILWTILSTWALLELIDLNIKNNPEAELPPSPRSPGWLWNLVLIGSIAAGLLTFYLFAYWVITLAVLVIYLDRRRWWQLWLRLAAGVLLTLPWAIWGTRQQLRNADFGRFNASKSLLESGIQHLQDLATTIGTNLVVGDWATSFLPSAVGVIGVIAIALLFGCTISLWRKEPRLLEIALILGLFPLLLALLIDIFTRKFTLGFGYGRTMILIVPGCLLLVALWIEKAAGKWRELAACALLIFYLSVNVSDFSLRQRGMFNQVANLIRQAPTETTLVAMNSHAWGNIMRLAYYTPPNASVQVLAQPPAKLASALETVLKDRANTQYSRLIWLDFADPIWSRLKTETEQASARKNVEQVLQTRFCNQAQACKTTQQPLVGTMPIDQFTVNLYTRKQ